MIRVKSNNADDISMKIATIIRLMRRIMIMTIIQIMLVLIICNDIIVTTMVVTISAFTIS